MFILSKPRMTEDNLTFSEDTCIIKECLGLMRQHQSFANPVQSVVLNMGASVSAGVFLLSEASTLGD